ncbi:unnamed protein product [Durusdinium trenchii]|uniref:Secreted protein n=1 Tax=Durusdinium trenchii TaxID=1381693 RepID=A0ABP0LNG5_9DINO
MAQRRRGRRGGHLLLGLVGVLGAMRLMAERMDVGFAGWRMDPVGLGPGALPRLRRRTGGSLVPHAVTAKTVAARKTATRPSWSVCAAWRARRSAGLGSLRSNGWCGPRRLSWMRCLCRSFHLGFGSGGTSLLGIQASTC